MSKKNDARMGAFLREVSNWRWSEFFKAENDKNYSSNQAIIFALVRACALKNLQAIRLSINRLDGKLATPVKLEYPKIFYLYPNAKPPEKLTDFSPTEQIEITSDSMELLTTGETEESESDLPSLSIRATVAKMSDYPRSIPEQIVENALKVEMWLKGQKDRPDNDPLVKSVVAAHLLIMAQNGSIDALGEVFDNIDGKLAETYKILGEDLYLVRYDPNAPDGAVLNEDGVYQIQAEAVETMWANKLGKDN